MTIDQFPLLMQIVILLFVLLFLIESIAGYFYTSKARSKRMGNILRLTRWPVTVLIVIIVGYSLYVREWEVAAVMVAVLIGRFYWDRKFISQMR